MTRSIIIISALILITAPVFSAPQTAPQADQKTAQQAVPTPQEKAAAEYGANTILYETIGLFSAHSVYLSYVSIGTLADSFAGKTYDKDFVIPMTDECLNIITTGVNQLNKLILSGMIQGEDLKYINGLIEIYDILKAEASAFKNYAATGDKEHLKIYSAKRQLAWDKISVLLGIK